MKLNKLIFLFLCSNLSIFGQPHFLNESSSHSLYEIAKMQYLSDESIDDLSSSRWSCYMLSAEKSNLSDFTKNKYIKKNKLIPVIEIKKITSEWVELKSFLNVTFLVKSQDRWEGVDVNNNQVHYSLNYSNNRLVIEISIKKQGKSYLFCPTQTEEDYIPKKILNHLPLDVVTSLIEDKNSIGACHLQNRHTSTYINRTNQLGILKNESFVEEYYSLVGQNGKSQPIAPYKSREHKKTNNTLEHRITTFISNSLITKYTRKGSRENLKLSSPNNINDYESQVSQRSIAQLNEFELEIYTKILEMAEAGECNE